MKVIFHPGSSVLLRKWESGWCCLFIEGKEVCVCVCVCVCVSSVFLLEKTVMLPLQRRAKSVEQGRRQTARNSQVKPGVPRAANVVSDPCAAA